MARGIINRSAGLGLTSVLVIAFILRALVPQGFMPSAGNPFVLQICPDGFPAHLLAPTADPHAAHHGAHSDAGSVATDLSSHSSPDGASDAPVHHPSVASEHCLFGAAAAGVGPPSEHAGAIASSTAEALVLSNSTSSLFSPQRYRLPPSRAPPQFS